MSGEEIAKMKPPAKKPKLGSGARFAALKKKLAKKPAITNPAGLAAKIGREKFGKEAFQAMATRGRASRA